MKNIIFILIFLLIFCNYPILSCHAKSGYKVYSPKEFSPSKINTDEEKIIFLVDFSNSMNEYLGERRKIEVALRALHDILPKIPKSAQIGLRVYGHRSGVTPIDACLASKLVVPVDKNNFRKIYRTLERIAPIGMTPITYSIKQSLKNDFGVWQGKKRIIILTDGGETCDESPCNYALKIIKERNDVQIDVIAFSVNDVNAMEQLKCAALVTNGKFYNADTYANLVDSLNDSFKTEKSVEGVIIEK